MNETRRTTVRSGTALVNNDDYGSCGHMASYDMVIEDVCACALMNVPLYYQGKTRKGIGLEDSGW